MSLENIQVIGFDLDGTLYPSTDEMQGRIRPKIYERLASEFDILFDVAKELFEEGYNGSDAWSQSGSRTIEHIAESFDRNSIDGREIVQQALEQADILDLMHPNPGLYAMLRRLSSDYHLDLITGTSSDLAHAKLQRLGVEAMIFESIVAQSKTNGEVYQHWIQQRQTSPNQMLYIGDNKKQDIDSPKALGIRTCIVGKPYDGADYHIENILELEGLFN